MMGAKSLFCFTVDVEDWPQSSWDRSLPIGDYCADNTRRLLEVLAEFPQSRATFFVLGLFAEKHPDVVAEIRQAGHEIASHGYGHEEVFRIGRERFVEDVKRSTDIIANACGIRPRGFRAPDFSIVGESLWALDILAEQGYAYDSSIVPIAKSRYGIANWPFHPTRINLTSGRSILEVPVSLMRVLGSHFPLGGGYARLAPAWLLTRALKNPDASGCSVAYYHPYEHDAGEFRRLDIRVPSKVRLHQGIGRRRSLGKIHRLLQQFTSVPLWDAIRQANDIPPMSYKDYVLKPATVIRPPVFQSMQCNHEDSVANRQNIA